MFNLSIGEGGNCPPMVDPKWEIQEAIISFVCDFLEADGDEAKMAIREAVYDWIRHKQFARKTSVWKLVDIVINLGFKSLALFALFLAVNKFLM